MAARQTTDPTPVRLFPQFSSAAASLPAPPSWHKAREIEESFQVPHGPRRRKLQKLLRQKLTLRLKWRRAGPSLLLAAEVQLDVPYSRLYSCYPLCPTPLTLYGPPQRLVEKRKERAVGGAALKPCSLVLAPAHPYSFLRQCPSQNPVQSPKGCPFCCSVSEAQ